jgi:hypothetical protein
VTVRSPGIRLATAADAPPMGSTTWSTLSGKPETFPPSPHTHPMDDVQQLDVALGQKLDAGDPGDLTLLFDNALA